MPFFDNDDHVIPVTFKSTNRRPVRSFGTRDSFRGYCNRHGVVSDIGRLPSPIEYRLASISDGNRKTGTYRGLLALIRSDR